MRLPLFLAPLHLIAHLIHFKNWFKEDEHFNTFIIDDVVKTIIRQLYSFQ